MLSFPGPSGVPLAAVRRVRVVSRVLALALLLAPLSTAGARAETLEDQQQQLEDQAAQVQESLEFVDSSLVKTASQLAGYKARRPAAESLLTAAQARVAAAVRDVNAYTARIAAAEETLAALERSLDQSRQALAERRKMVGRIAAEAYKRGGTPEGLSLFFGSGDLSEVADGMTHSQQALKAQNAAIAGVSGKTAKDKNTQARQAAVRQEISDLKQKAEAALKAEEAARDEAASAKQDLDELIAATASTERDLEAKKPKIVAQLRTVKAEQQAIAAQIAERQRREREAWLAAEAAKAKAAAEAQAKAEAAARARQNAQAGQGEPVPVAPAPPAAPPPPAAVDSSSFGISSPFAGGIAITSGFGWRATPPGTIDFLGTGSYLHSGIDFGASCGTPVYASAAGTVTTAGWTNGGGGYTVMVSHGVVQGNALTTVLYHNSSVIVSTGQRVSKGQLIAYSGSTGNSTGCHAHFETWLNGSPVDPMGLL